MPKNKWRHYAIKEGYEQKGYIRKHSPRSKSRKTCEASCSDSIQRGGESQEENSQDLTNKLYKNEPQLQDVKSEVKTRSRRKKVAKP